MNARHRSLLISLCVALTLLMCVYPAAGQTQADPEKLVNLHFKDVPVRNAIEMLFGDSYNYVIDPAVQGTVNLRVEGLPFTDALHVLMRAANLTAVPESGVYMIMPRREYAPELLPTMMPEVEVQIERERIPEKIPIGYTLVNLIGAVFGSSQGVGSETSYMGGGMMGGGYGGGMMGGMGGGMMGGMGGGMMGGMGGYGGGMTGGYGGMTGGYGGGMGRW